MRRTQKQYSEKLAHLLTRINKEKMTHKDLTNVLQTAAEDTIPKRLKYEEKTTYHKKHKR